MYLDFTRSDIVKALGTVVCKQDLELDLLINRLAEWINIFSVYNKVQNSLNLVGTFLDLSTKANNFAITKLDMDVESAMVDMTRLKENLKVLLEDDHVYTSFEVNDNE